MYITIYQLTWILQMHLNFLMIMLHGLQFVCRALLRSIFLNFWYKYEEVDAVSSNVYLFDMFQRSVSYRWSHIIANTDTWRCITVIVLLHQFVHTTYIRCLTVLFAAFCQRFDVVICSWTSSVIDIGLVLLLHEATWHNSALVARYITASRIIFGVCLTLHLVDLRQ